MKLLFGHNLSRKLVLRLASLFPDSTHVALVGLEQADDLTVWNFARSNGYTIVTKDSDFNDVSVVRGAPPKIVWLRLGNCTTTEAEQMLRKHAAAIQSFLSTSTGSILEIV